MRKFNTTGICVPEKHYMVDTAHRVAQIKAMVDAGQYFAINRARQFGKTTTLTALAKDLRSGHVVLSLDFQGISSAGFRTEEAFVRAFSRMILMRSKGDLPEEIELQLQDHLDRREDQAAFDELFMTLSRWCALSPKPIVMIIDEVDSATNDQVFLDFLAQLRLQYIARERDEDFKTFQSVILAGVTDIKHLRRRIRPEIEHKSNSPWNIAADFDVIMSFDADEIAGMLGEYEEDHHTGMDVGTIAQEIYDFTSGYPFLVSRICQLMDEQRADWGIEGIGKVAGKILMERNALFGSIMGKVRDNDGLRDVLERTLFAGDALPYDPDDIAIEDAAMYGLIENTDGKVRVSNRIFEMRLYNFFLFSNEMKSLPIAHAGTREKESFVVGGRLQMELLLQRYVTVFNDIYGGSDAKFDEAEGRRRFLLFVRAIINGGGNYYIEAQTRDMGRMDLVIDYGEERFVVELKIWRGNAYNERGEKQLMAYLDHFHLKKGYMLSYDFNKGKTPGVRHIQLGDKELIEAVV